jgi:hypothetical protein
MRCDRGQRGGIPGVKKLYFHPTNLTDSTVVAGWKALGCLTVDGFVESVGLIGGLFSVATRAKQESVTHSTDCCRHVKGVVLSPVPK